jgi:hypothetical protein
MVTGGDQFVEGEGTVIDAARGEAKGGSFESGVAKREWLVHLVI